MYETHFGLKKRPFRALAAGGDVFVGPQAVATLAAIKKALVATDSVVAIGGPIGVGKTTIVQRALEDIGAQRKIISVGRIKLGQDEVLELLLQELGVTAPAGTVQRFTTFRRHLKELEDQGIRAIIVVEDAARIGADSLSELEALTAADAGVSDGANIILMGDQTMAGVLTSQTLVRMKQRMRLGHVLTPLTPNELMGYFKHCFRLAGREYDEVFEAGSVEMLHQLSQGIPRKANSLVESCLASAAEIKVQPVSLELIQKVASDEYGLQVDLPEPLEQPAPAVAEEPAPLEAVQQDQPDVEPPAPIDLPEIAAPAPVAEELADEAQIVPVDQAPEDTPSDNDDIPELIQDTLPDLAILAPALANAATVEPVVEPPVVEPEPDTDSLADAIETVGVEEDDEIPTLSKSDEVPEWERDPTLAELRPDLDALEHAMAVAQGLAPEDPSEAKKADAAPEIPELVPEITLDRQIQAKIEEATELLKTAELEVIEGAAEEDSTAAAAPASQAAPQAESAPVPEAPPIAEPEPQPVAAEAPVLDEPAVEEPVAEEAAVEEPELVDNNVEEPDAAQAIEDNTVNRRLGEAAANLARAKTIDDCDDLMAETLFGEDFSMIAAQFAANAPPPPEVEETAELSLEESAAIPVPDFEGAAAVSVEITSEPAAKMDASASQRLRTVQALNSNGAPPVESVVMSNYDVPEPPAPNDDHPETIEEQINTSITQTLKALSVRPPPSMEDDEDDDEDTKGGFFSRFRRS